MHRTRLINRSQSTFRPTDPAQNGGYHAHIAEGGALTILGPRNLLVFHLDGVVAAKWEVEADDTILLVLREEVEDDPVVVRAFRTRTRRYWETEDAHASARVAPNGKLVAVEFSVPNSAVAVLPSGKVVRDFLVRGNLAAPAESIDWDADELIVRAGPHSLAWTVGSDKFRKLG
jgi:hypothetical protein